MLEGADDPRMVVLVPGPGTTDTLEALPCDIPADGAGIEKGVPLTPLIPPCCMPVLEVPANDARLLAFEWP